MTETRRPTRRDAALALGAILLAQAALLLPGISLLTATYDEQTHLPAGYVYLATGEFDLNPQHPPLVKLLAALPLRTLDVDAHLDEPYRDEWAFGARLLYTNDTDALLFRGRLPIVAMSLLLTVVVWRWAGDLTGPGAAIGAALAAAFSPTILAHSRFVTFDAPLALFATLTLWLLWRWQRDGAPRFAILGGLALGATLVTKFSGVLLLPALAVLLAPFVVRSKRWGLAVAIPLLAAAVIQAAYFFPLDFGPWLDGIAKVNADRDPNFAYYLMGTFREGGFPHYFLVAFLVKTSLPLLIALVATVALVRRLPRGTWVDDAFLWLPALVFFLVTSWKADNIGVRYLLPVYPLLCVFVSRLTAAWCFGRAWRIALLLLAAWHVGGTVRVQPDQLAFFNEIAGGPRNGWKWLDDSNVSWGQDVKRIKRWMDREGLTSVKLRYGRNVAPERYGIRSFPISDAEWAGDPAPGIYLFDTHLLIRGEMHARQNPAWKTDWLSRYEPVDRIGYSCYVFRFD